MRWKLSDFIFQVGYDGFIGQTTRSAPHCDWMSRNILASIRLHVEHIAFSTSRRLFRKWIVETEDRDLQEREKSLMHRFIDFRRFLFERRGWGDGRALLDLILSVHVRFSHRFDGVSDCRDRKVVSLRPQRETFVDNQQLRRNKHRKIFYFRWWSK